MQLRQNRIQPGKARHIDAVELKQGQPDVPCHSKNTSFPGTMLRASVVMSHLPHALNMFATSWALAKPPVFL